MSAESYQKVNIFPIGDFSVGKTSLSNVFKHKQMPPPFTIGISPDFIVTTISVDSKLLKLLIWETHGSERFRTFISRSIYRRANGIMLVYDITNRQSFENLKEYWYKEVCQYSSMQTECILVGNKCDLESERAVDVSEGKEFADSLNIPFIETSAKDDINVEKAFVLMAAAALKKLTTIVIEKCDKIMIAESSIKGESYRCFC